MNDDFLHDTATTITRALVGALSFPSEDDELAAFTTLFPIVTQGLEAYAMTIRRTTRRPPGPRPKAREGDVDRVAHNIARQVIDYSWCADEATQLEGGRLGDGSD